MDDRSPLRTARHAGHRNRPQVPAVFHPLLRAGEGVLAWAPADTEGLHVALLGAVLPWLALNAHYAVAVTDAGRVLFVHTSPSLTVGLRVRGEYAFALSDVSLVACNHRFLGGVVLWLTLPDGAPFDSCQPHGRPRRLGFTGAWARQACGIASLIHGAEVHPRGFAF